QYTYVFKPSDQPMIDRYLQIDRKILDAKIRHNDPNFNAYLSVTDKRSGAMMIEVIPDHSLEAGSARIHPFLMAQLAGVLRKWILFPIAAACIFEARGRLALVTLVEWTVALAAVVALGLFAFLLAQFTSVHFALPDDDSDLDESDRAFLRDLAGREFP